jgi:3-methylcrotonyl-CoA carboxylase alpha subunit
VFAKLLIANRGEIACRIIGTARRLGIATVAVYSEADRAALHVALADAALPIGPAPPKESYLNIAAILAAARASGAEAVHPGYGFLSENADFAEACEAAGLVFVGPPAEAIRLIGDKARAKALLAEQGVPLVPGYHGPGQDPTALAGEAEHLGFPILIKAAAGGGGRGMRIVETAEAFAAALAAAKREAKGAFGDDRVLLEKYLARPRHIEVQIFADRHGNAIHLFERDCSLQRRHQKVVEEAPAPGLDDRLRRALGEAAVRTARAAGYVGAGTVEFLVADGAFHFIEMNTRLQVEHPVTEAVTGEDLVEWQLRVAAGETLPRGQQDLACRGHAIEARLYAEDPERGFLPQTGVLRRLRLPPAGLARVDTGVREGDQVTPFYDPMIAKIIVHGTDREAAVAALRQALGETGILGLKTNLGFLARLAGHPGFATGMPDTGFILRHAAELCGSPGSAPDLALAAAALIRLAGRAEAAGRAAAAAGDPYSPWARSDGWRLAGRSRQQIVLRDGAEERGVLATAEAAGWRLEIDGRVCSAIAERLPDGSLRIALDGLQRRVVVLDDGAELAVFADGESWSLVEIDLFAARPGEEAAAGRLTSPMPGRVVRLCVAAGDRVRRGDPLFVVEAMKMEHTVAAPADGVVQAVHFAEGDLVDEGAELIALAAAKPEG